MKHILGNIKKSISQAWD